MNDAWMILGTWSFSEKHVPLGAEILRNGGSAIEAVVATAKAIESDPMVDSVGYGGLPGWDGIVDLDAAIMDGETMEIGGVASLKGFLHPIEVARDVMNHTRHDLLVGEGAAQFADVHRHERGNLVTESSLRRWRELRDEQGVRPDSFENIKRHGVQGKPIGHDTVGIVARDRGGHFCAATSTSGLALKLPGRVGDSPICGAGLYADDRRGAAAATGVGEDIMRTALSFRIVDLMGRGVDALTACETAMRSACDEMRAAGREVGEMAVVAIDPRGGYGYAANHDTFCYTAAAENVQSALHKVAACWKA
jgi:isoaspartyl peptidase/L-asparaginase-like protein (Ntn-hydrolase superfamily)